MKPMANILVCALLSMPLGAATAMPTAALPTTIAEDMTIGSKLRPATGFEQVQFHNGRRYGRRYGNDGNIALGIGAAIIGGIILSEAARADHRRTHGSDWDRCERTYRSFDPSSGLYTGYDGVRRTCPYLR